MDDIALKIIKERRDGLLKLISAAEETIDSLKEKGADYTLLEKQNQMNKERASECEIIIEKILQKDYDVDKKIEEATEKEIQEQQEQEERECNIRNSKRR